MMQALLLLMMDPPPGGDAEFNAWANDEHIPERRNVPGFQTALRFQNTSASPRYLAIYDLDDLSVLQSPAYVAISGQNLSPWTKRILAGVTGRWRFEGSRIGIVCPPAHTGGRGPIGQLLLVLWRNVGQHCDEAVLKTLDEAAVSYQIVLTKADQAKKAELETRIAAAAAALAKRPAAFPDILATSAREDSGMPELRAAIARLLAEQRR